MLTPVVGCLLAGVLIACGRANGSGVSGPRTTWTVAIPTVVPLTLDEALKIIGSDPATGPKSLPVGELSAAVFEFEDSQPDTQHPEWQTLVANVCGANGLISEALAAGWTVTVTGFVDTTGPTGPGTFNDQLQLDRARAASQQLAIACKIPTNRMQPIRGGVGGEGASGRKVMVSYTR